MKGINLTQQQALDHQRRHGFGGWGQVITEGNPPPLPKPRMNRTEQEFSLMLEAKKRRGEILEWRFEGISLAWGCDPVTGKPMWFTPDFFVVVFQEVEMVPTGHNPAVEIRFIEVKGNLIRDRDLVRYKGARSDWPMFRFELHQRTKEGWNKIL